MYVVMFPQSLETRIQGRYTGTLSQRNGAYFPGARQGTHRIHWQCHWTGVGTPSPTCRTTPDMHFQWDVMLLPFLLPGPCCGHLEQVTLLPSCKATCSKSQQQENKTTTTAPSCLTHTHTLWHSHMLTHTHTHAHVHSDTHTCLPFSLRAHNSWNLQFAYSKLGSLHLCSTKQTVHT